MKSEVRIQKTEFRRRSSEHEAREGHEVEMGEDLNKDVEALRLHVARLEGAAKRLLDLLGCPADGRKGPEGTLEALREAADTVVVKKSEVRRQQTAGCRPEIEWKF